MKHLKIRRFAAVMLAMVLGLCPVLAQAAAFTPGDMLPTLMQENIAAGREITMKFKLDAKGLPLENEYVQAAQALLQAMEAEVRYYDDFGTACINMTLRMSDKDILTLNGRRDPEGNMTATTNLIPGKTLYAPAAWYEQYTGSEPGPAMQALIDYMPMAYLTYFYRLGGWVSGTQMYREDLYVSVDEEVPATDARDEVAQAMHYRVYNVDFLELLESVTFYFRDTDPEFKQHIADALAELGVTRGQLRQISDSIFTREDLYGPEHWITRTEYLTEEQLNDPVHFDDIYYVATQMAYSVKTCQEEMIEGVTDFIVSEGTDYQTVGFDGTMPQMWKDFPFENGSFTYNRKTVESEGVHHTAQGHMDLIQSGYAVDGDLDFYWAERKPDAYTNSFDIGMDFARESDSLGFDANVTDHLYMDGEEDKREMNAALKIYTKTGEEEELFSLKAAAESATQEIEGDFVNETTLRIALEDNAYAAMYFHDMSGNTTEVEVPEILMHLDMASGDYIEVLLPETVFNAETATQEEIDTLENELMAGLTQALYAALAVMPQEAIALLFQ